MLTNGLQLMLNCAKLMMMVVVNDGVQTQHMRKKKKSMPLGVITGASGQNGSPGCT